MSDVHSTYPLPDLLARWARGDLTVEQLAGYLLQHVLGHEQRLDQLEKALGDPRPARRLLAVQLSLPD